MSLYRTNFRFIGPNCFVVVFLSTFVFCLYFKCFWSTKKMESLISTVNQLQEFFSHSGYRDNTAASDCHSWISGKERGVISDVLHIYNNDINASTVFSDRALGKALLESLGGHDFLPKGSGIITRCPLVVQVNNVAPLKTRLKLENGIKLFIYSIDTKVLRIICKLLYLPSLW